MTKFQITVHPLKGEARVIEYADAESYSVAVHAYHMSNIKIDFDPSLMVSVSTRLPRNANYAGD